MFVPERQRHSNQFSSSIFLPCRGGLAKGALLLLNNGMLTFMTNTESYSM